MQNAYSVMADTTLVNTGKKPNVNERLEQFFIHNMDHDILVLESVFLLNTKKVQTCKIRSGGFAVKIQECIKKFGNFW